MLLGCVAAVPVCGGLRRPRVIQMMKRRAGSCCNREEV
jgi:hypothetical protein